eukprot:c56613_g1_i1 orf=62-286(+)
MLSQDAVFHACTEHIEIQHHYVCEKVLSGDVNLLHCSTTDQIADIFTKALSREKFQHFREQLRVHPIELCIKGG